MRLAIIGAMDEEVELIKNRLDKLVIEYHNGFEFYLGKYKKLDLIVVVSRIGKVAAGMLLGTLFSVYNDIDKVINVGVSGGVKGAVKPGEVVVSEKLSYADADVRAFNYEYGQMAGLPLYYDGDKELLNLINSFCYKGVILTGDSFQTNEKLVKLIIDSYFANQNVMCFDMESTAFAQCCYLKNIGFLAIRAISDVIGNTEQESQYENCMKMACEKADDILMEVLEGVNNGI